MEFPVTEQSPRADFNYQLLNLARSEPDFARRRTAALLLSSVRRVHPPEGSCHRKWNFLWQNN